MIIIRKRMDGVCWGGACVCVEVENVYELGWRMCVCVGMEHVCVGVEGMTTDNYMCTDSVGLHRH